MQETGEGKYMTQISHLNSKAKYLPSEKVNSLNEACRGLRKGMEAREIMWNELEQYQKTGCTAEQIVWLLEKLNGMCWLCEHGKCYYQKLETFNGLKNIRLTKCDLKMQGKNVIAKNRIEGCECWELKKNIEETIDEQNQI
jgi:hypothetical protein